MRTSLRYRLTCVVVANGRQIVRQKVRELYWRQRIGAFGSLDTSSYGTRGEALFLPIGGRLLIATLAQKAFVPEVGEWRMTSDLWTPMAAFRRGFGEEIDNWRRHKRRPVVLSPTERPVLVTFADADDRGTVREVDPQELSATFGRGVRLESMSVEVLGDPIGRGEAERRLPWLDDIGEDPLERPKGDWSPALAQNLGGHHFRVGL